MIEIKLCILLRVNTFYWHFGRRWDAEAWGLSSRHGHVALRNRLSIRLWVYTVQREKSIFFQVRVRRVVLGSLRWLVVLYPFRHFVEVLLIGPNHKVHVWLQLLVVVRFTYLTFICSKWFPICYVIQRFILHHATVQLHNLTNLLLNLVLIGPCWLYILNLF